MERQRYAELAPLRTVGIQRLLSTQRPDLSALFAAGQSNPFARSGR
jgi:hypothetical protein